MPASRSRDPRRNEMDRSALLSFVPFESLSGIVTDSGAPADEVNAWRAAGVAVVTADPGRRNRRSSVRATCAEPEHRGAEAEHEACRGRRRSGGRCMTTVARRSGSPAAADDGERPGRARYRSNLLGADRALANQGGGNTSAKEMIVDHTGRETACPLGEGIRDGSRDDHHRGLPGRPARRCASTARARGDGRRGNGRVPPAQCDPAEPPRPSIETLLHAFISATHVDHTHPDAVIALTSTPRGRELAEEAFGDEIVWLDYQRPGFDMSRRIALLLEANQSARAVLLAKHGLVTWGETGEESVQERQSSSFRVPRVIDETAAGRFGLGGPRGAGSREPARNELCSPMRFPRSAAHFLTTLTVSSLRSTSPEAIAFASAFERLR